MKIFTLFAALALFGVSVHAQTTPQPENKKPRKSTDVLVNECYLAYTYGSLLMTNDYIDHSYDDFPDLVNIPSEAVSYGGIKAGYNRGLNRVLAIGILLNYEQLSYTGDYPNEIHSGSSKAYITDNIFTEVTMLTIHYLNKPVIRLYSAVGLGIGFAFSNVRKATSSSADASLRKTMFAGQITFIGLRVGRSLGGFMEIGVGSASMISLGMSYKFSD